MSKTWMNVDEWLRSYEPELPEDYGAIYQEATGLNPNPFPQSSLIGVHNVYSMIDDLPEDSWSLESGLSEQPAFCRYCGTELEQKPKGRTRRVCPAKDCQRQADTDKKRRQRKRMKPYPPSPRYSSGQLPCVELPPAEPGLNRSEKSPNPVQLRWRLPAECKPSAVALIQVDSHSWSIVPLNT